MTEAQGVFHEQYGPLGAALERQADGMFPYLKLLHLGDEPGVDEAVRIIREAMAASPDLTEEVCTLLGYHWRPQLVGAMAIVLGAVNERTLEALWQALARADSMAIPRLAAVAYRVDPDFESQARCLIEAQAPLLPDDLQEWCPRVAGSLIYLCRQLPSGAEWLSACAQNGDVQALLDNDVHNSSRVCARWLERLDAVMRRRQEGSNEG